MLPGYHPYQVRLLGLLIEPEHVPSLMTELCPLGSLHTLLFGGGASSLPSPHLSSHRATASLPTTSLGAAPPATAAATTAAASVPRHGAGLQLLSWRRRLELAQQLVSGVAYLHGQSPPLIHRDLKPHNCLLDAKGALKVADYPPPLTPHPSPLAPRPSSLVPRSSPLAPHANSHPRPGGRLRPLPLH